MCKQTKNNEDFLSTYDVFAAPVPTFNFEKNLFVGTWCGFCGTLVFITSIFIYGVTRLYHLLSLRNPLLSEIINVDYFMDESFKFDLVDEQAKIAFTVTDYFSLEEKGSEDYVEWEAYMIQSDGIQDNQFTKVGVHRCNQEDYDQFYNVVAANQNRVAHL
jgi:hypothetical protein